MTAGPLSITARAGRRYASFLQSHLTRVMRMVATAPRELSVALVGDAAMARLHERFLGVPGPTDVLTFELDHDARGRCTVGEVVVCVPEARRQARGRDGRTEREVLLYAVHGLLHLSGYDDKTPRGYRAMHEMEDRILTRLGVGPVFAGADWESQPSARIRRSTRAFSGPARGALVAIDGTRTHRPASGAAKRRRQGLRRAPSHTRIPRPT